MRPDHSGHPPFYVTLELEGMLLHNCMVDTKTTSNVMPLKIKESLGLKIYHVNKNLCGFESKIVPTHGLIQGQRSHLHVHPYISFLMDIVVVEISISYGVLLSRKWTSTTGVRLQMDLAYASI